MVNDLVRTGTDRVVGDHACLLVEAVRAVHRAAVVGKNVLKCCDRLREGEFTVKSSTFSILSRFGSDFSMLSVVYVEVIP